MPTVGHLSTTYWVSVCHLLVICPPTAAVCWPFVSQLSVDWPFVSQLRWGIMHWVLLLLSNEIYFMQFKIIYCPSSCQPLHSNKFEIKLSFQRTFQDQDFLCRPLICKLTMGYVYYYFFSGFWNHFVDQVRYSIAVYSTADLLFKKTVDNLRDANLKNQKPQDR